MVIILARIGHVKPHYKGCEKSKNKFKFKIVILFDSDFAWYERISMGSPKKMSLVRTSFLNGSYH